MAGFNMNPIQQHDAMKKEQAHHQKHELLNKACGTLNNDERVAQGLLQL